MSLTRILLTLAVTGAAVNLYLKNRRGDAMTGGGTMPMDQSSSTVDEPDVESDFETVTADEVAATGAGATTGADSPNAAERLEAGGLAQVPDVTQGDDLLAPESPDGQDPIKPGLPDLTRGA
jgi:hypothetical protein